ncbi:hypothetical protein [Desulfocastanea catecholica]
MIQYIHSSRTLDKDIKRLRKAGKQGEQAVGKYIDILADIRKYGCRSETVTCKRTRKGEQRIKNCIKYDLGGGYRLVTVLVDTHLYITFLGSHDETDQWFLRHRYDTFQPDASCYHTEEVVFDQEKYGKHMTEPTMPEDAADQYEKELRKKIDEPLLKSVFQGLYRNSSSPTG